MLFIIINTYFVKSYDKIVYRYNGGIIIIVLLCLPPAITYAQEISLYNMEHSCSMHVLWFKIG